MFKGAPDFFNLLDAAILATEASRQKYRLRGFDLRPSPSGSYFVYGLSLAAAKWRLADVTLGIDAPGYSDGVQKSYSGQLRVTLSVIALEAYAKVTSKRWHQMNGHNALENLDILAGGIRAKLSDKLFTRVHESLRDQGLKDSILAFKNGDNERVVGLAVAIRHCFAHGLIPAESDIVKVADGLRSIVLNSIKASCIAESSN